MCLFSLTSTPHVSVPGGGHSPERSTAPMASKTVTTELQWKGPVGVPGHVGEVGGVMW